MRQRTEPTIEQDTLTSLCAQEHHSWCEEALCPLGPGPELDPHPAMALATVSKRTNIALRVDVKLSLI